MQSYRSPHCSLGPASRLPDSASPRLCTYSKLTTKRSISADFRQDRPISLNYVIGARVSPIFREKKSTYSVVELG